MTHGTLLIKSAEKKFEVELHTTHDGHVDRTIETAISLPLAILKHMYNKKSWQLQSLIRSIRRLPGSEAELYRELLDSCNQMLYFNVGVPMFASYMISAEFETWFPMPVTDDKDLLDYWGHGDPDVVVTIDDDRIPQICIELGGDPLESWGKDGLEGIFERVDAELQRVNGLAAPHACCRREGYKLCYNFVEIVCAVVAKNFAEFKEITDGWQ